MRAARFGLGGFLCGCKFLARIILEYFSASVWRFWFVVYLCGVKLGVLYVTLFGKPAVG